MCTKDILSARNNKRVYDHFLSFIIAIILWLHDTSQTTSSLSVIKHQRQLHMRIQRLLIVRRTNQRIPCPNDKVFFFLYKLYLLRLIFLTHNQHNIPLQHNLPTIININNNSFRPLLIGKLIKINIPR